MMPRGASETIPGTASVSHLEDNVTAAGIALWWGGRLVVLPFAL